jgi:hypothetical protein
MPDLMPAGIGFELHAGEVETPLPGYDAWVIGDEPVVAVDWYYASANANV